MSNNWDKIPLVQLLTPSRRPTPVESLKEYKLLGVRLDGNGPFLREEKKGSQLSASTLYQVRKDDFVYSRLFAWRGAFGVIPPELDGCYVSNEFPTFTPHAGLVDIGFLRYWFRLPVVLKAVEADCKGSTPLTRNRYKEDFFLHLQIPRPPLSEQLRIVAKIDQLAAKIEEARVLRHQVAEEAAELIISNHLRLAGKRVRRLGEIVRLDEDMVPVRADASYPQVGVKSFGGGLFAKSAILGTETTYRTFNRLFDGALVLSQVKGWEGAVAVCPKNLAGWFVSPEYRTFRCVPGEARPDYLASIVLTKWFWQRLTNATRGVGARRERTRPEQFLKIEIPMPDLNGQKIGERIVAKVNMIKRFQSENAAPLEALLPSILDKAFKGEL